MTHDHWSKATAKRLTRDGISGLADNLSEWKQYSCGNSYHPDRQQLRRDISGQRAARDLTKGLPDVPDQKNTEGRGWTITNELAARNSYTGKGGSKRG